MSYDDRHKEAIALEAGNIASDELVFRDTKDSVRLFDIFNAITVGDDGRLKISLKIPADVDLTVEGSLQIHVTESRLDTTEDNAYVLTGGVHHTNPSDFESMSAYISPSTTWAESLMEERAKLYKAASERSRKRAFYLSAARRNMMRRKPKGCGGCGCS